MRIAILAPSIWSEVAVATCLSLARAGHPPVGAIALPTIHAPTMLRKAMQWGPRELASYAARRMSGRGSRESLRNVYLAEAMQWEGAPVANLRAVAERLGFPLVIAGNMNSAQAVTQVQEWQADAIVYTGGGILRGSMIRATRIGVINMHAGLLPEIRGMSCPEWSLLVDVPIGVTVHLIDDGVDTGAILLRRELAITERPSTIRAVRDRLAPLGIELLCEAVAGLAAGTLHPVPQEDRDRDRQYFVIHRSLAALAERRLVEQRRARRSAAPAAAGAASPG